MRVDDHHCWSRVFGKILILSPKIDKIAWFVVRRIGAFALNTPGVGSRDFKPLASDPMIFAADHAHNATETAQMLS